MVYWVDNKTAPKVKPKKNPVASAVATWFTDQLGQTPTIPQADWFNMVQSELLSIAEALGVTADKSDDEQLGKALTSFFNNQPISNGYDPKRQYESGDIIKHNGDFYECYNQQGCKGIDPTDSKNRPSGWANSDIHAQYYWIKIGKFLMLPEIGSPIYLMTMNMREGLIKLRNDAQLSAKKFWRIAELNPNLVKNGLIELADLRANVIRSLDDGKGVDSGRVVNSYQNDATQKAIGTFPAWGITDVEFTGVMTYTFAKTIGAGGNSYYAYIGTYDNSITLRTASEERMKNIAMLCTIRI